MTSNQPPLVTVVILVYNTGKILNDTLTSIKNQNYSNIEHIIIDDCSSDDSVSLVSEWIQKNNFVCNFIKHTTNKGISATINEAIGLAKGKYFSVIGDDIMLPHKVAKDVAHLEANPESVFCYSKMILRFVDKDEERGGDAYKGSDDLFYDYISQKVTITTPTVTYKKSIFDEVGLFDESLIFEDFDMYLRMTYNHKASFINYYSIIYNINSASIQSRRQIEFYNEFLNILDKKWSHLPNFWYYKNNRHQYIFCQLAASNKKEAVKHLLPALSIFWKMRLYKNLLKFIFIW